MRAAALAKRESVNQKFRAAAWLVVFMIAVVPFGVAHTRALAAGSQETAGIPLFTAPDENSPLLERVADGELASVVAQSLGPGGTEWYLVRTRSDRVGWIKAGATITTKTYNRSFKSLSSEPSAAAAPGPSGRANPGGTITVPLDTRGSLAVVAVTFNGRLTANLAVDTGATKTMISRRIADHLALNSSGSGLFSGIGGTVAAAFTRVDSIRVGAAEVTNLTVVVHDFSRSPSFEGLLGMDFLTNFSVAIDSKRQLLILRPR
jgi:predicted aspartyl protease